MTQQIHNQHHQFEFARYLPCARLSARPFLCECLYIYQVKQKARKATSQLWPRSGGIVLASLLAVMAIVVPALATSPKVAPSAASVSALVKSSLKATKLSKAALAALPGAPSDITYHSLPRGQFCDNVAQCTLGSPKASKTVVLFGDSHAAMWVPAILPAVVKSGAKLVLLWKAGCPAAKIDVYAPQYGDPGLCNASRANMITMINQLKPEAVLISEHSGGVPSAHGFHTSKTEWATALTRTIRSISAPGRSVAVIEDTPQFPMPVPACLSAHLTAIQECTVIFGSPSSPGLQAGQVAATKATGARFIPTQSWFCTTKCPAVIGDMIVYVDGNHLSKTYATYLSGVMGAVIKPMLH
jgi:hypothetical protein